VRQAMGAGGRRWKKARGGQTRGGRRGGYAPRKAWSPLDGVDAAPAVPAGGGALVLVPAAITAAGGNGFRETAAAIKGNGGRGFWYIHQSAAWVGVTPPREGASEAPAVDGSGVEQPVGQAEHLQEVRTAV
jgi:hypothetical protein